VVLMVVGRRGRRKHPTKRRELLAGSSEGAGVSFTSEAELNEQRLQACEVGGGGANQKEQRDESGQTNREISSRRGFGRGQFRVTNWQSLNRVKHCRQGWAASQ